MLKNDYEQILRQLDILQSEAICHNNHVIVDNRRIVDCRQCEYAIDGYCDIECSINAVRKGIYRNYKQIK